MGSWKQQEQSLPSCHYRFDCLLRDLHSSPSIPLSRSGKEVGFVSLVKGRQLKPVEKPFVATPAEPFRDTQGENGDGW